MCGLGMWENEREGESLPEEMQFLSVIVATLVTLYQFPCMFFSEIQIKCQMHFSYFRTISLFYYLVRWKF